MTALPVFVLLSIGLAITSAQAANWPAWRGPTADGISSETELPTHWSATENVTWKVDLPERGNSTPIVWEDRIFLTQAVGERRTVMCVARSNGRLLWQKGPAWSAKELTHETNPYCSSSPVCDGERVVAWFGSAGLWCWDLDGKEQWHLDLGKQEHIWGYGSSPVLHGDLCFLNFGPGERSFIVAVDKQSGKERWRTDVPPPAVWEGAGASQKWSGSWSTPVVLNGVEMDSLVVALPGAVRGFDLGSGREMWHCDGLNPLVYANPLLSGEIIAAMGGFGGYSIGFKAGASSDLTASNRLWQAKKSTQRIGSGVAKGGFIFMPNESGVIQCLDPKAGEPLWQERLQVRNGGASTWSSFVLAGDLLYLMTQASDTVILKAGPKYEQVAVNSLEDGLTNSSIAISAGQLFLRTHKHLWCIGAKH